MFTGSKHVEYISRIRTSSSQLYLILYKTACQYRCWPARPLPRYLGRSAHSCPLNHSASTATCQSKHQSPILHTAKSTTAPSIHLRTHENSLRLCASGPAVTTFGSVAHYIRIICWCCVENIYLLTYLLTYSDNNQKIKNERDDDQFFIFFAVQRHLLIFFHLQFSHLPYFLIYIPTVDHYIITLHT